MMPFVRRCGAAVLDGVSEVVDGGTTTVRAGERPKTRVSLRVIPQRRRQVMLWCGCQHAFVANWHPRAVSPGGRARTRAARRSKASGVFLSVSEGLRDLFDVPAGSPSSAHDEVEASPCDPHAGPPNELPRLSQESDCRCSSRLGLGGVSEDVRSVAERDLPPGGVSRGNPTGLTERWVGIRPLAEQLAGLFTQKLVRGMGRRGQ